MKPEHLDRFAAPRPIEAVSGEARREIETLQLGAMTGRASSPILLSSR
jgi:hypothetical protein